MFSLLWINEFDELDEMKTTLVSSMLSLTGILKQISMRVLNFNAKNKADCFLESLYKVSQEMQTEKYPEQLFIRKALRKIEKL